MFILYFSIQAFGWVFLMLLQLFKKGSVLPSCSGTPKIFHFYGQIGFNSPEFPPNGGLGSPQRYSESPRNGDNFGIIPKPPWSLFGEKLISFFTPFEFLTEVICNIPKGTFPGGCESPEKIPGPPPPRIYSIFFLLKALIPFPSQERMGKSVLENS